MAKATIAGLATFATTFVDKAKQAGAWKETRDNLIGLLDKVGKIETIDGEVNDKLTILNGENLPFGKTIEEYFIDFLLPTTYAGLTEEAKKKGLPETPSVEDVSYSYTLGRLKFKTTIPYDNWERACIDGTDAGNITGKVLERLTQSVSLSDYACKKQLLANLISKASAVDGLTETLAVPTDTATGEAFIKSIKNKIQDSSFAHQGGCLAGADCLIGATPASELVLFVKKGVAPSLEVDTLAGAFDGSKLNLPVREITVDDFGDDATGAYAILADVRGIKFHNTYNATRGGINEDGDFENIVRHKEDTAFLSKYTYVHVYKA